MAKWGESGLEIVETIHPVIIQYHQLLRAEKLGVLEQEYTEEKARNVYRRYIEIIQALEAPRMSREAFLEQVPTLDYDPGNNPDLN